MITAARPTQEGASHYYWPDGRACWNVPNKSKPGEFRKTTVSDCRKLGLWPSPTTVVRLLHRHALVEWQIEQAVLATLTTPRGDETLDAYVERVLHTERVQDEEKNSAAERGKAIHQALQDALTLTAVPSPELSGFVIPACNAIQRFGRIVATEKNLVGDGYCGMTDCIVENDHEVIDVDFKTCGRIPEKPYEEQLIQVGAYCGALGNTGNKTIRGVIIYISTKQPGEIKVCEVKDWQKEYRKFRLLLEFWFLSNNYEKPLAGPLPL